MDFGALSDLERVPVESIPTVLGQLEAVRAKLWARLRVQPAAAAAAGVTDTLTTNEAAQLLGVTSDWLYRRPTLPFRIEIGPKVVRYSRRGIERWVSARMGAR